MNNAHYKILKKILNHTIPWRHHRWFCQCAEDVLLESPNRNVGIIKLNRPQYMNALNVSMLNKIATAVQVWSNTKALIIYKKAFGSVAFCPGSDYKRIAEAVYVRDYDYGDEFFFRLYMLCNRIACLRIPFIAIMDGLTMGSGLGLCLQTKYRVATENTLTSFPELGIGFFPDCAAAYWLSRLPIPYQGIFLGLTGQKLFGTSVYQSNLASHYIRSKYISKLEDMLLKCCGHDDVKRALDRFHAKKEADNYSLVPHLGIIDTVFAEPHLEGIVYNLEKVKNKNEFARCVLKAIRRQCPMTTYAFNEAYLRARHMCMIDVFNNDLQMAKYAIRQPDFYEGVRAQTIDKDFAPKFNPNLLDDVEECMIKPFFDDCKCSKYLRIF